MASTRRFCPPYCCPPRLDEPAAAAHIHCMSKIKSVCVYCASGPGTNPAFVDSGRRLGQILADSRIRLVYGGGSVGLMGALAASMLDHGGFVTGVIPDFLVNREHMMERAQERIVTRDMHERKRIMFERADAFAALPGGIGTLEELVEQITWAQLGRHRKPIVIVNIGKVWAPLLALFDHMKALAFIRPGLDAECVVVEKVEHILPRAAESVRAVPEVDRRRAARTVERT